MDIACFQDHLRWISWNTCLEMELNNTNKLFDKLFTVVNNLLDTYAPCKKLSMIEIKPKKTWLAKGILASIKTKNRLYRKSSRSKDKATKMDLPKKVQKL